MTRKTRRDIEQLVDVINTALKGTGTTRRVTVESAYGQPRAYITDISEPNLVYSELSPRLPMGQMYEWLDAFARGLTFTQDHPNK